MIRTCCTFPKLLQVRETHCAAAAALLVFVAAAAVAARAQEAASSAPAATPAPEDWSLHAQLTAIGQGYPAFNSPFQGANSLPGNSQGRETVDGTAFLGARLPWQGGEAYFDPEFNQGFGIGHSLGIDGFVNGEAAKAGYHTPKPNVARLFVRQVFGLGGEQETIAPDENQLGEAVDVSRIIVTAGKMSASDIFDNNQYAHDPRTDFLNDSFWESVAWDYPADAKGYTDGAAVELNEAGWALRGGWFLEPKIQNQRNLDPRFLKRYGAVVELETRHVIWGEPGKIRSSSSPTARRRPILTRSIRQRWSRARRPIPSRSGATTGRRASPSMSSRRSPTRSAPSSG